MSVPVFYALVAVGMFCMSIVALLMRRDALLRLIALNVMGVGVFTWLVGSSYDSVQADSVPHALVLTGIVVAVSATAYGLALLVKLRQKATEEGGQS